VFGTLALLHEVQRVLGLRLLLGDQPPTDGHDQGDDAVDPLGGLVLGGLEVAGGILGDGDVGGPPARQKTKI
jgi:hypothetical protein